MHGIIATTKTWLGFRLALLGLAPEFNIHLFGDSVFIVCDSCHWRGWQWRHLLITFYDHVVDAILYGNWIVRRFNSPRKDTNVSMPNDLNLSIFRYRCWSASGNPQTIIFRFTIAVMSSLPTSSAAKVGFRGRRALSEQSALSVSPGAALNLSAATQLMTQLALLWP